MDIFLTYLDKRIARVRVGKIPPEINPEWLAAAGLQDSCDNTEIAQTTRTRYLN